MTEAIHAQKNGFDETVKKFEVESSKRLEAHDVKFDEITKKLDDDSVAVIAKLDGILKEAQEILQVISRTGLSGGHGHLQSTAGMPSRSGVRSGMRASWRVAAAMLTDR